MQPKAWIDGEGNRVTLGGLLLQALIGALRGTLFMSPLIAWVVFFPASFNAATHRFAAWVLSLF